MNVHCYLRQKVWFSKVVPGIKKQTIKVIFMGYVSKERAWDIIQYKHIDLNQFKKKQLVWGEDVLPYHLRFIVNPIIDLLSRQYSGVFIIIPLLNNKKKFFLYTNPYFYWWFYLIKSERLFLRRPRDLSRKILNNKPLNFLIQAGRRKLTIEYLTWKMYWMPFW